MARRDAREAVSRAAWERDRLINVTVAAVSVGIEPSELAAAAGHEDSGIVQGILITAREEAERRRRSWAADRALRRLARLAARGDFDRSFDAIQRCRAANAHEVDIDLTIMTGRVPGQ